VNDAIRGLTDRVAELEQRIRARGPGAPLTLIVFSGSLDRQLAAFQLATAAAASGSEVDMFFTFWGLSALRNPRKRGKKRDLLARALGWLLPRAPARLRLSARNFGGIGKTLLQRAMREKRIPTIEQMTAMSAELGVRMWACELTSELFDIGAAELIEYPHLGCCGLTQLLARRPAGATTLFL
jgi:peroxiredoxin family protein